jgi:hypothetical protein
MAAQNACSIVDRLGSNDTKESDAASPLRLFCFTTQIMLFSAIVLSGRIGYKIFVAIEKLTGSALSYSRTEELFGRCK